METSSVFEPTLLGQTGLDPIIGVSCNCCQRCIYKPLIWFHAVCDLKLLHWKVPEDVSCRGVIWVSC